MTEPPQPPENPMRDLMRSIEEAKDPEEQGQALGKTFASMFKRINESIATDQNPAGGFLAAMFGAEAAARVLREVDIRVFFEKSLLTNSMRETILLTKAQFGLPDDYTIKINLTVSFAPAAEKAPEPDVD